MHIGALTIQSNIKSYTAYFEDNAAFVEELATLQNTVFVVDENVWKVYAASVLKPLSGANVIPLPISEEHKNIDTVCSLYEKIMQFSPRKNLNLVSVGGGITQDLTGFVASTLYRGVNWIFVPTTLLGQVDSCIGAKTSLNFKRYKNLVGTFYPPQKIYIYPEFLKSLTRTDFYSGVGEMAKLHLMRGEKETRTFVEALTAIDAVDIRTVLERTKACLEIKRAYIEDDEFDTGRRNMLNYGHCFGHAIESSTNFAITHGQAVVFGMLLANHYAKGKGRLSAANEKRIREQVLMPSFKTDMRGIKIDVEKTVDAMGQDKKNLGKGLALVILTDGHEMEKLTDVSREDAAGVLNDVGLILRGLK